MDLIRHRNNALRNIQHVEVNEKGWDTYLDLISISFQRQIRKVSIDSFEQHISSIDWQQIDSDLISDVSALIGYVYLE